MERTPSSGRWQRYDPSQPAKSDVPPETRFYFAERDELWVVRGPDGEPYRFFPFHPARDLAIGTTGVGDDTGETVLLDLDAGTVSRVLPFWVNFSQWLSGDRLLVQRGGGLTPGKEATAGADSYAIALSAMTVTRLSSGGERIWAMEELATPLPPGAALPGATSVQIKLRPGGDPPVLLLRDATGAEQALASRGRWAAIAPGGRHAANMSRDGRLEIFDLNAGRTHDLGSYNDSGQIRWSPDGRYFALGYWEPEHHWLLVLDLETPQSPPDAPPRVLGRYRDAALLDWFPDLVQGPTSSALLLGDYCLTDGFALDRLALPARVSGHGPADEGAVTRIPTAGRGFWEAAWSPRGGLMATASQSAFISLLDAGDGTRRATPALDRSVSMMQSLGGWSASGRWLQLADSGGRSRCRV